MFFLILADIENGGFRAVTMIERGCANFPVSPNADTKCYDLKNSKHMKDISPEYSLSALTVDSRKDEVNICREDLCNRDAINVARFCQQPGLESGIGRIAARIRSAAPKISPGQLMFLVLLLI